VSYIDDCRIPTNESEWEALLDAWIQAREYGKRNSDYDPFWWAVDGVLQWHLSDQHEALWQFITRIYERQMSDRVFAILAAGELEDLLASFGEIYIERIEELARKSPRFNYLLGGVWKNAMTDDVWLRVQEARLSVW
jgi:hypothetical protein